MGAAAAALVLMIAPTAAGQAFPRSVDALAAHAGETAANATADPAGFAANATTPAWQGAEFNWTKAWTCDAAAETAPPAGDALSDAGVCPALADIAAGADEADEDEADAPVAEADELDDDAVAAAEDAVAAVDALLADTLGDPKGVADHVQRFVARVLDIVRRILGAPAALAGLVADGVGGALGGLGRVADATIDGVADAGRGIVSAGAAVGDAAGAATGAVGDALGGAGHAVGDAAAAVADATRDAARHVADAVGGLFDGRSAPERTRGGPGTVGDAAPGATRGLPLGLGEVVPAEKRS